MLQEAPTEISLSQMWPVVKGLGKVWELFSQGIGTHPLPNGRGGVALGFLEGASQQGLAAVVQRLRPLVVAVEGLPPLRCAARLVHDAVERPDVMTLAQPPV